MYMHSGDFLKYGLTVELSEKNESEYGPKHFMAFLVYYTLIGYIDKLSFSNIVHSFEKFNEGIINTKELYKNILEVLVKQLKKYYVFSNSTQMFEQLNTDSIPDWVLESMDVIVRFLPDAYLIDDSIFYIWNKHNSVLFRRVRCECAGLMDDFILDGCSEQIDYPNYTISPNYSKILGIDRINKVLYLELKSTTLAFGEYYVEDGKETIINNKFIGMIKGKNGQLTPLIEDDNSLLTKINGEYSGFDNKDFFKTYMIIGDELNVYSSPSKPSFSKPYILSLVDGLKDRSYMDCARFMITNIWRDIGKHSRYFMILLGDKKDKSFDINEDTVITLDYFERFIRDNLTRDNTNSTIYLCLINLLRDHYKGDEDILDLLYLFGDLSKKMNPELNNMAETPIVSPRLCNCLVNLSKQHVLGNVIRDADKLCDTLNDCIYWDEKKIDQLHFETANNLPLIGYYDLSDGGISACTCNTGRGVILGGIIMLNPFMMKNKDGLYKGSVTYNLNTGQYDVQYNRKLSNEEKKKILDRFKINNSYHFFVTKNSYGGIDWEAN